MKVLLVNGSPHEKGCTYTALNEVANTLKEEGIEAEIHWIGTKPVASCIACGKCKETKKCVFNDKVNELGARLEEFDGVIIGSPVYYAAPSGQICSFMDRLHYSFGGRLQYKAAAAVVSCRRGGASAAFDRLNKYFTINNMFVIGSQYWNQVHGNDPEEVVQDEEGMQTMRTLARNMAWFLKNVEAGRKAGIELPAKEKHLWTNFIR